MGYLLDIVEKPCACGKKCMFAVIFAREIELLWEKVSTLNRVRGD